MRRLFHIGVLGPDAMIAEVIAMIAPQDDDGVVGKPFAFERLENLADLDIDVGNAGIIAVQQLALQFGRKLVAADVPRRSEEHTSTPVTNANLVCRLLLEKKKLTKQTTT